MKVKRQPQILQQVLGSIPESRVAMDHQSIPDHVTAMVTIGCYDTGQYIYVSEGIRFVTVYEPKDLLTGGREFALSKIHPDDIKEGLDTLTAAFESVKYLVPGVDDSRPFFSLEFRLKHKDGHWIWLHRDECVYSRTADGKVEFIIATAVNIDTQKAYEAELLESARKIEESHARLRRDHEQLHQLSIAKDEFVSIATHQLRTPATGVKQYLGLLLQVIDDDISDTQRDALQAAYDCNERVIGTIDNLLRSAQINEGKVRLYKKRHDLIKLIEGVLDEQAVEYGHRNQELHFHFPKNKSISIDVDAQLIVMVLENLIDNARKYSAAGKDVEVRLRIEGKYVEIDIQDHGIGIQKKDQPKLFKKYSRIENEHTSSIHGTGLGLYWAKQIIKLHGGKMFLKSSTNDGSTFTFTLPIT